MVFQKGGFIMGFDEMLEDIERVIKQHRRGFLTDEETAKIIIGLFTENNIAKDYIHAVNRRVFDSVCDEFFSKVS
jgi:hypothetical protein